MANFDLQGETDLLSEKQIQFIGEVLEKQGFKGSKVTITSLGKAGDNYVSNVKAVVAEREDGETLKMVAKVSPTSEALRSAMSAETLFRNEFLMYNKVLPKFRELEIEAEIPEEDRFKFPNCYGILDEIPHETLLLEDLRESDYVIKDRFKSLTNEEVRVVLSSFAKFHALSFVLKVKDALQYKKFASNLNDFFTQLDDNLKQTFDFTEVAVGSLFDSDRYKDKVKGCVNNIIHEANKIKQSDAGSKYGVIVHGDSWVNNVLFKQNVIGGTSESCMLIDYQLSCERCPVNDVLYIIFTSTDYETRSKHYNDWIEEYHEKLDTYLSRHGIKSNYVYSKEKMLADLQRYSKFFLGWSIVMASVLCMGVEAAAKVKSAMESTGKIEEIVENTNMEDADIATEALLKKKVEGIIDSYYELGFCS